MYLIKVLENDLIFAKTPKIDSQERDYSSLFIYNKETKISTDLISIELGQEKTPAWLVQKQIPGFPLLIFEPNRLINL